MKSRLVDELSRRRGKKRRIIMQELIEILEEMHPDVDFMTCETLIDGGILDSFDIVTLIAEIVDTFDVVITAEYMTPENFNSAKSLYALIEELENE